MPMIIMLFYMQLKKPWLLEKMFISQYMIVPSLQLMSI